MAKNLEISLLFDFYKNMLTKKQADIFDLYYNEDLSLAEISQNLSISRQGALDAIKHAETALLDIEDKLGIYKNHLKQIENIEKLKKEICSIYPNSDKDKEHLNNINKLLSIIEE